MRRVVVTGLGMVSPLATGVEETWSRLLGGQSGAGAIAKFDAHDLPCRIACEVTRGDGTNGTFNPEHWMDHLTNSRRTFLCLLEKARSFDEKAAAKLAADRNYQALDQMVIEHLLGA